MVLFALKCTGNDMAYDLGNNPFARAHREVRSWPAVVLWLRIKWLCQTYKREWITRTRKEWLLDLDFTMQQYKDAMAVLRQLKLIETAKTTAIKGTALKIRMTERGINLLDFKIPTESFDPYPTESKDAVHKKEGTLTSSSFKKEESEFKTEFALESKIQNSEVIGGVNNMPTVHEMLSNPKLKKIKSGPVTVSTLIDVWQEAHSQCYPGTFGGAFTLKQKGQLAYMLKIIPKDRTVAVIDWTVRNWLAFIEVVKIEKGYKTVPAKPTLSFLQSNLAIAINHATHDASDTQPAEAVKPTIVIIKKSKPVKKDIAGWSDILD